MLRSGVWRRWRTPASGRSFGGLWRWMGLRGRATVRDYAYGGGGFSPPEAGPPQADVPSSIGVLVWFVGMGWRWKVRDSWAGEAGGQPAMTPRGSAVADEVSGEFSSTSLRSTIRRDGSAYSLPPLGGWGSPKGTAVESAGGTKAPSQPCIEGLVYSRAMRIALTRTRRMNGASSRLVTQAYILLRVDGPSIAWMVGGRVSRGLW